MQAPSEGRIADLLAPYSTQISVPHDFCGRVGQYLDLLQRWNAHTNLTAVRDPEQLVQRQVGESIFAAALLKPGASVLDFGSGAGFPGIPLQLLDPVRPVTLAESQGKKASFLREAVRVLGLSSCVWAGRVEDMPEGSQFDVVTLRAVDCSVRMLPVAAERVCAGGHILLFSGNFQERAPNGWVITESLEIPLSSGRLLLLSRRSVPRGTI